MSRIREHIQAFRNRIRFKKLDAKQWRRVFTITIVTWFISHTIIYDLTSTSFFTPLERSSSFEMSDFYNVVADMRPVRSLNSDIIIVSIDNCSRTHIAQLLDVINFLNPRAVGMDVMFNYFSDNDSAVVASFNNCHNLVMACDVNQETDPIFKPYLPDVKWGAINLVAAHQFDVVRQFRPQFNDSTFSFAMELARITSRSDFFKVQQRENDLEFVYYPSQVFEEVDGMEILNGEISLFDLEKMITNRIVLLGDTRNPLDQHQTPHKADVSGVMIHAYTLATILENNYVQVLPDWLNWTIAIIVSLLMSFFVVRCQNTAYIHSYIDLMALVVQVLYVVLFLYAGCVVFTSFHVYFNFGPALMMVTLTMPAAAIETVVTPIVDFILDILRKIGLWLKKQVKKLLKWDEAVGTEPEQDEGGTDEDNEDDNNESN